MNIEKHYSNNGIGFGGLLQITFIVLKLTKVIDWNWFWVLAPTILPILLVIAILLIVFIFYILAELLG